MPIPLPQKPRCVEKTGNKAVIEIENLYPGYGMTLGNALRRALLSSLEGAAVTTVKIQGVPHEFSILSGVKEDVVQILLNIKQLRFRMHGDEPQRAQLKVRGEKSATGKDIELPSQLEIVNPQAYIANVSDKKTTLEIELTVEKGFGYVPVETRKKEKLEVGTMALDAIFTPIRKINYEVENMRVGERTDFERLRFLLETNGTIGPEEAFIKGARVLVDQFQELVAFREPAPGGTLPDEVAGKDTTVSSGLLSDLGLSARVLNTLEGAGITTVEDLVTKTEAEILAFEGMGAKGIADIKKVLKDRGVELKQ